MTSQTKILMIAAITAAAVGAYYLYKKSKTAAPAAMGTPGPGGSTISPGSIFQSISNAFPALSGTNLDTSSNDSGSLGQDLSDVFTSSPDS
jgi:hypothetical protein